MTKIESFEELFEEIRKNLYPRCKFNKSANMIQIFTSCLINEKRIQHLNYRIHNTPYGYAITISVDERIIAPITKDPQKIYDVILAIKQCEDSKDDK